VCKSKTVRAGKIELNLEVRLKDDDTDFVNGLAQLPAWTARCWSAITATTWDKRHVDASKHRQNLRCHHRALPCPDRPLLNGESLGIEVVRDTDAESYAGTEWFTANDLNGDWDDSSATYITLQGDGARVSGGGAYAYDGGVVISGGGWYVLSGTLTDGSITVAAQDSSKVWIRLDGVDVSCSDDACLRIDQADKVS
jgi:hypothetical protein